MNEQQLADLIRRSAPESPDLWQRIRLDIARKIAQDLMVSLDAITNPSGGEVRDKTDELVHLAHSKLQKGA